MPDHLTDCTDPPAGWKIRSYRLHTLKVGQGVYVRTVPRPRALKRAADRFVLTAWRLRRHWPARRFRTHRDRSTGVVMCWRIA